MVLNPRARHSIYRILIVGAIWFIASLVYVAVEKGLLGELDHYPSTKSPYSFKDNLILTTVTGTLVGLLVGSFEVLLINRLFKRRPFIWKVFYKALFYVAVIFIFLLLTSAISNSIRLGMSMSDDLVLQNVYTFLTSFAFISVMLYISIFIAVSLLTLEVVDKLGIDVTMNFLTGKYHTPTEEERVFMFLDMRSSTTVAERIGHVRYFQLLQQCFADLSDAVLNNHGSIYQYVGDEMVISWPSTIGIQNGNCIRCYTDMRRILERRSTYYLSRYGHEPVFKAGMHVGLVTVGEVGESKKDIVFTGDVLNTAARIQGLCNEKAADILISGQLKHLVEDVSGIEWVSFGSVSLRGKDQHIALFGIADHHI